MSLGREVSRVLPLKQLPGLLATWSTSPMSMPLPGTLSVIVLFSANQKVSPSGMNGSPRRRCGCSRSGSG